MGYDKRVKKPAHQWETRLHHAYRIDGGGHAIVDGDARAEAFELRFVDGRIGTAVLGLQQQEIDDIAASDPDIVHAISCWLVARGQRSIQLGNRHGGTIACGDLSPRLLGDPPAQAPAMSLVTLCPSNAELVAELHCFHRVLACEDSTDSPLESAALTRLGPDLAPDLEEVVRIQPDLV